ncbi:hypothetical protein ONE63_004780 [Megalurothrips usitatus]|uniref:Juvenile hormone acid O-methyltransferase n=1 Tax=Megalurothrips usitatus TaxID=439358 RepID=A0AAV7X7J8_9NEOP|nr:hypothetical protein ONE63_004780 [Megalurothrips usitatus]
MDNASLYACANCLQKRDASRALEEFLPRMTWGSDEMVLDVGCGPGDVTAEVLLPKLPSDVSHVVGLDLSASMVRHAADRYRSHKKLTFAQSDISAAYNTAALDVPGRAFSKLFSFYCLHWVQDQRGAMHSICRLLSPGGEALLVFLAGGPIFKLWEKMAKNPKWTDYMQDISRFISPYQHCADPAAEFYNLLAEFGLEVLHCSCRDETFMFDTMESLKKQIEAVTPFLERMPVELRASFIEDCMDEVVKLGLIQNNNNNGKDRVNTRYLLLIAHARKPALDTRL